MESTTSENVIEIDIYKSRIESLQASTICKDIRFIPLSSEEGHLIGGVSKIIKTDEFYFILDAKSTKRIYAFNVDGTFSNTICSNGKGPGEYLNPIDFVVDRTNETVIVLDQFRKFIKIDYSGNLLVESALPQDAMFIEEIFEFEGVLFVSTGKVEYNKLLYQILKFDESLNIAGHFLPYETGMPFHYAYKNKFFNMSGELFYVDVFDNKVYMYDGEVFVLKYDINFSKSDKTFAEFQNDHFEFLNSASSAYLFESCVAGDSISFLPVYSKGKPHYGYLNNLTSEYMLINEVVNDLASFVRPISFYNNRFISVTNSYSFNEVFPYSSLHPSPSDNPVIVEYEIDF